MEEIGVSIEEINAKSKINRALFQGDMVLTKEQAEKVLEDVKESEAKRRKRQAYRDKWYPKTLWSDGVYYAFYSNATDAAKRVFRKAALFWQNLTCIKFTEDRNASNKILVIKEVGCWSHVGRTGGTQGLSLGKGCETIGTAAHEIAHALGFFHMQSRYDRDDFIKLHWENFKADWATQFSKETNHTNYNYNLTYDYGGVMHYGATGFVKYQTLSTRVINILISVFQKTVGQLWYHMTPNICKPSDHQWFLSMRYS
uniref:Metalloendopeptidase n=1 Tax=Angiostrongylus cantonensis TaxID=6313 RepID=A0A0K0DMG8_ANGCA